MAVDSCLITENTTETVQAGFLELGVNQVWQSITDNRTDTANDVLADPTIPAIGSSQLFNLKRLWAISRTTARVDRDETGRKWNVNVTWSNNTNAFARDSNGDPIQNPIDMVKDVVIDYQEYTEPITDAKLVNVTKGGPFGVGDIIGGATPTVPPWFSKTIPGNVMVSTGEAVIAERTRYQEVISVTRTERDWTGAYKQYTNALNDDTVVITEEDSEGVRATYTFAKNTLRMKPVTKEKIWQDAKLYYRVTFTMEVNELTWILPIHDVSQKRRVFVGPPAQKKKDASDYTQADVNKIAAPNGDGVEYYIQSIMTNDDDGKPEAAIGDPVSMNGYGAEQPVPRADGVAYTEQEQFFLNYITNPEMDFGVLNL